jgi:hypothetical protein
MKLCISPKAIDTVNWATRANLRVSMSLIHPDTAPIDSLTKVISSKAIDPRVGTGVPFLGI